MSGFFGAAGLESALLSRRFRLFAVGALIGLVFVVLASAFGVFAVYLSLLSYLTPWQAALCVACGALVAGAMLLLVAVNALTQAVDQVQVAVKTNALVKAAPFAARLALRNPRLVAGVAAVAGALFALLRAMSEKPKKDA